MNYIQKNLFRMILLFVTIMLFIACGGSGSSTAGEDSTTSGGGGISNSSSTIQHEFTPIIGKTGRIRKGTVEDVKVSKNGHYSYIANGWKGFAVVDVSNPKKPRPIGNLSIEDTNIKKITLSHDGKTAFLVSTGVAKEQAVYIVDISNPASPTEIGKIQRAKTDEDGNLYNPLAVTVSKDDKKVYIGYEQLGFSIVDIADKSNPIPLGKWTPDDDEGYSTVSSITLSNDGKVAYIGGILWGFHIIDISDSHNPKTHKKIMHSKLFKDDSWQIHDVSITEDGKVLYVLGGPGASSVVEVYDIVDPKNPKAIESMEVQFGDEQLLLSEVSHTVCIVDNLEGYEYIDISNPKKLTRIKGFNIYPGGRADISKDGKYLYISGDYMGMYIADTSYKNDALLGYLNNPKYSTHDIAVSNDKKVAYLALHQDGVMSIDISNPTNIKELTTFEHDEFWVTDVQTLKDSNQIYASDTKEHYGIKLVDTSVPSHLSILNEPIHTDEYQYRIKGARGIVFAQKRAYIADENDGLKIFDVSNPNDYKLIKVISLGQDEVGSELEAVTLSSDLKYAYVLNSMQGLKIVDIDEESKTKFEKVGEVKIVDSAYHGMYIHDVAVTPDNKLACITDDSGMLFVVDVSDPTKPKKRGAILGNEEDFHSMKMSKDNKTVYIASGENGLTVVDISNPDKPKKIGRTTLFGDVYRLEISKDETKAYVIGSGIKLQVVDLTKLK